jgi:hypothetical protein
LREAKAVMLQQLLCNHYLISQAEIIFSQAEIIFSQAEIIFSH